MVKNRGSKRTLTPKDTFLRRVRHVQRRGHRRGIHRSIAEIIQEIAAAVWVPAILPDGLEFELDLSSAPANSAVIDAVSSATSSAPSSAAVDASTDQQGTRSETGLSGLQLQDEFCELLRILPHLRPAVQFTASCCCLPIPGLETFQISENRICRLA